LGFPRLFQFVYGKAKAALLIVTIKSVRCQLKPPYASGARLKWQWALVRA
jgi:hypothetical protein